MNAIYASKLYLGSTDRAHIRSALANPVNVELVQQLRRYIDDDYQGDEYFPDKDASEAPAGEAQLTTINQPDPDAVEDTPAVPAAPATPAAPAAPAVPEELPPSAVPVDQDPEAELDAQPAPQPVPDTSGQTEAAASVSMKITKRSVTAAEDVEADTAEVAASISSESLM